VTDRRIVAGLGAQAQARDALLAQGARRLGWKAGLGTAPAMAALGLDGALVGFLTDRSLVADGATVAVGSWETPLMEPEIAVRLGAAVAAGAGAEQAAQAVDAVAPAIELIDLGPADDVAAILAGNLFHRYVVLGAFRSVAALDGLRIDARVGERVVAAGVDPRALLGDLAAVIARLGALLPAAGDGLRAGDVVITGAAVAPVPVAPGDAITVAVPGVGAVDVAIG
jgi:2-oxo-3-hexenedioate decarboxylase